MSDRPVSAGSKNSVEHQRVSSEMSQRAVSSSSQVPEDNNDATPQPDSSLYLLKDPKLKEILLSDVGVEALLLRLKQSVATAKEMSIYIKKMATIEQEHSAHLKKMSISMTDAFKRSEIKKGTCQNQILNMMRSTDRYGDAGVTFIDTMHKIHDELNEVVKSMERARKTTKETALRHEKALIDAEKEVEKAKAKYDQACEELEKHRTSDPNKSKLGFKNKSEEELHRRMQIMETDYQQKVDNCVRCRQDLTMKYRVGTTNKLQGLILECDNALALQLTRYANLMETLQLNRGFVIAPLKPQNQSATQGNQSMREMAAKIDSELDFYNFICSVEKSRPVLNRPTAVFKKHPALGPDKSKQAQKPPPMQQQQPKPQTQMPMTGAPTGAPKSSVIGQPSPMLGQGTAKTGPVLQKSPAIPQSSVLGQSQSSTTHAPPVPTTLNPAKTTQPPAQPQPQPQQFNQVPPPAAASAATHYDPSQHGLAVYGTPLEDLLDYEEGTVPRVVYQCVQAIDNFGLDVEGIYRTNGNKDQISAIREQFDIDAAAVDLLRPKNGVNDIHSVANALKQYFLSLPDSLLTKEFHQEFLSAAAINEDIRRRDSIHAIINKLPDPNYTTLRYLVFHLYRVQERSSINKMDVTALGVVWGPVLMHGDPKNVSEIAIESRAVQSILANAYAIFEAE